MAAAKIVPAPLTRPLSDIAREIEADYERRGKPIYFAAVPYVNALFFVNDFTSIRLLGNLSTWRGETATRVKTELRAALAWHQADVVRRQVISLMPHRR
jgi:hypothetical protein